MSLSQIKINTKELYKKLNEQKIFDMIDKLVKTDKVDVNKLDLISRLFPPELEDLELPKNPLFFAIYYKSKNLFEHLVSLNADVNFVLNEGYIDGVNYAGYSVFKYLSENLKNNPDEPNLIAISKLISSKAVNSNSPKGSSINIPVDYQDNVLSYTVKKILDYIDQGYYKNDVSKCIWYIALKELCIDKTLFQKPEASKYYDHTENLLSEKFKKLQVDLDKENEPDMVYQLDECGGDYRPPVDKRYVEVLEERIKQCNDIKEMLKRCEIKSHVSTYLDSKEGKGLKIGL